MQLVGEGKNGESRDARQEEARRAGTADRTDRRLAGQDLPESSRPEWKQAVWAGEVSKGPGRYPESPVHGQAGTRTRRALLGGYKLELSRRVPHQVTAGISEVVAVTSLEGHSRWRVHRRDAVAVDVRCCFASLVPWRCPPQWTFGQGTQVAVEEVPKEAQSLLWGCRYLSDRRCLCGSSKELGPSWNPPSDPISVIPTPHFSSFLE